jgi:hypothetical protein
MSKVSASEMNSPRLAANHDVTSYAVAFLTNGTTVTEQYK